MKKLFAVAILALSALASAGPNDIVFTVRNSADNGQGISVPVHPTSGPSLMIYSLSTLQPDFILPGTCLTISSGVLALTTACTPTNADWTAIAGLGQILNKPSTFPPASHTHSASDIVSGTLDAARLPITLTTTGSGAATYNSATGALNIPTPSAAARSFSYTTRALNTCFQPSATRDVLASYSVDIATSLSLTAGQQGTVYLRTYTNSSCTTGAQEITRFVNGQTGTLTIGLALTQNVTGTLTGVIPAGAYVQLVTENNTGTPTFTARPGQETAL